MTDLLAAAGGSTEPLQALLVGGYFGTWVDADAGACGCASRARICARSAARSAPAC